MGRKKAPSKDEHVHLLPHSLAHRQASAPGYQACRGRSSRASTSQPLRCTSRLQLYSEATCIRTRVLVETQRDQVETTRQREDKWKLLRLAKGDDRANLMIDKVSIDPDLTSDFLESRSIIV